MLNDVIETASRLSDSVIVSFSGGRDSVVVLDLCRRFFKTVHVFFMYQVAGLEFQERVIRHYESRFGFPVLRVPDSCLSGMFRYGYFRAPDDDCPIVLQADVEAYVRSVTGADWIASGEKIKDSIWRRAMIKKSGSIDYARRRVYPLAYWSRKQVDAYVRMNRLPVANEAKFTKRGSSFSDFSPYSMAMVKQYYPKDYETIKRWFPFIEASVKKYEIHKTKNCAGSADKVSDV
jgi:phosphoadenosine phosphosulfate reductase